MRARFCGSLQLFGLKKGLKAATTLGYGLITKMLTICCIYIILSLHQHTRFFIPTYRERVYTPFENPIDISVIRPLWKRGGRGDLIRYLILGNEEQPMVAPAISTL
jgi:hypothetical protein